MNKAKQLVIAILCGFGPDHKIFKESLSDKRTALDIQKGVRISKADLFSIIIDGKHLFEHEEAWRNLDVLAELVRQGGEDIKGPDFLRVIKDDKCAGEFAAQHGALGKIFTVPLWRGHMNEMEQAWIKLYGIMNNSAEARRALKLEIAKAEGKDIREAKLLRMGVDPDEIRKAIDTGSYKSINEKFTKHGDHLRKEDLFIPDKMGDHMMDNKNAWENAGRLWEELARHGEILEVKDILEKRGEASSVFEQAMQKADSLNNLFHPVLWRGRMDQMLELFSHVPDDKWGKVDIESVLNVFAEEECRKRLVISERMRKTDLLQTLTGNLKGKVQRPFSVRPLGLESTWKRIDEIAVILAKKGEALTIEDLRIESGSRGDSCLILAARYGCFDKAIDIIRKSGGRIAFDDLTKKTGDGKSLLGILMDKSQLPLVLAPELWVGRAEDLIRVWKEVPSTNRADIDFQSILGRVNLLSVRERFANRGPMPG